MASDESSRTPPDAATWNKPCAFVGRVPARRIALTVLAQPEILRCHGGAQQRAGKNALRVAPPRPAPCDQKRGRFRTNWPVRASNVLIPRIPRRLRLAYPLRCRVHHPCGYVPRQFVYLKGRDSACMCLVKITGVGQPESWGLICLCPLRKGQVITVEGLGDHPPPTGIFVSTADYWCTPLSRWLAGVYPEKSEDEPLTGDRVLKSATNVYVIQRTLVD